MSLSFNGEKTSNQIGETMNHGFNVNHTIITTPRFRLNPKKGRVKT